MPTRPTQQPASVGHMQPPGLHAQQHFKLIELAPAHRHHPPKASPMFKLAGNEANASVDLRHGKLHADGGQAYDAVQTRNAWRCCTDQWSGCIDSGSDRGSGDTDGVRASKLEHAVEDVNSDVYLGRPAPVRVRAQPVTDHLLEARHRSLGSGALGVAGRSLPGHAAVFGNMLEVTGHAVWARSRPCRSAPHLSEAAR